jgi:two-component system response regulator AtoC
VRYAPPMTAAPSHLLTWSDRGDRVRPSHHGDRPASDEGPVRRLLRHGPAYASATVLCTPRGREPAEQLVGELADTIPDVRLRVVDVADPSDHEALFTGLRPALADLPAVGVDVLLSAGTPQMQTLWVLLVKAELLKARMVQVIPPSFVPVPHPHPVREVRLDFAGFPEIRALRDEVGRLRARVAQESAIIGESEAIVAMRQRTARVARAEVPALILGETGTGKELVARAIHEGSARAKGPFVAESCGAFAEGVLQSELFGHEAGAFTGAAGKRKGLFEVANGGTLFLDEVGELPMVVQAALLRVLQEGAVRRVGGERPVRVDVRVVSATHRDLQAMVRAGTFREDLYFRLCGATIEVPALRERLVDLERLVAHFQGPGAPRVLSEVWRLLRAYPWPGNVRELRAEVTRWAVFCDAVVGAEDLSPAIRGEIRRPAAVVQAAPVAGTLGERVEAVERAAITEVLGRHGGNLMATARELDIDRNTLKRKLAAWGMGRAASMASGRPAD